MKKLLVIGFTLIFLMGIFRNVLTIAFFHLNQAYIASELCINRNEPASCCKGKCVLTKQLKDNNDKEKETPAKRLSDNLEQKFVLEPIDFLNKELICITKSSKIRGDQFLYTHDYIARVFHPPKV